MHTIFAVILMCQFGMNHSAGAVEIPEFQGYSQAAQAAYEERELMLRYKSLTRALNEFLATYKTGRIDMKRVKAVRKALHDLQGFECFEAQRSATGAVTDADN